MNAEPSVSDRSNLSKGVMMSSSNCKRRITGAVAALGATLVSIAAVANPVPWQMNLPKGVTPISHQIWNLHMAALWVCVVLGILVFGAMFIAMFRFRRSKGAVAETWSHNTLLELGWTIVPVLILAGLATPATILTREMYNATDAQMTVKVTGYQWLWRYEYIGTDVNFVSKLDRDSDRTRMLGSGLNPADVRVGEQNTYLLNVDNPLVLPTDTKIRFVITANDVIHAWWVPVLGWKQDAIPGFVNEAWTQINEPGTYRGQCAELCGKDHGFMPIVVEAVPKAQFDAWLAERDAAAKAADAPPVAAVPAVSAPTDGLAAAGAQ